MTVDDSSHKKEAVILPPSVQSDESSRGNFGILRSQMVQIGPIITRPGVGKVGESCGKKEGMHCDHCGYRWEREHNCMDRGCPRCYEKWAYREGATVGRALDGYIHGKWIVHGFVSFKGELKNVYKMRPRAYAIIRRHGIRGAVSVPHFERHKRIDGYLHYHFVGEVDGSWKPGGGRNQDYIFKVISTLRDSLDITACVGYLLTHCAIADGRHALSWIGAWFRGVPHSDNAVKPDDQCPKCKSPDVSPDYRWDMTDWSHQEHVRIGMRGGDTYE